MLGGSLGFVQRPAVDSRTGREFSRTEPSLFVPIASASYRIRYLESIGMYWYVDAAQIYDVTHSMPLSQFGFSLSRK